MTMLTSTKPHEEIKNRTRNDSVNQEITTRVMDPETIISDLIRHDSKAKDPKVSMVDYVKHANVISCLLETVEKDFDTDYMIKIYRTASQRVGQSIGPIKLKLLQTFIKKGMYSKNYKVFKIC